MSHSDTPTNPPPLPSPKAAPLVPPRSATPLHQFIQKAHKSIRLETAGRILFLLTALAITLIILDVSLEAPLKSDSSLGSLSPSSD